MKIFLKIERMMSQIKRQILKDEEIRKLLYYGTPDALEQSSVPTQEEIIDFIHLSNYVDRKQNENQNAFIVIYVTGVDIADEIAEAQFQIAAYAWENTSVLNNDKIRTLRLIYRITEILEGKNLNFTGKIHCYGATIEGFDNGNIVGYTSTWGVTDDDGFNEL